MVRYEEKSRKWWKSLPIVTGLRQKFKSHAIRLFITFIFWAIAFSCMMLCVKIASFRFPKNQATLPDILYEVLPPVPLQPMSDVLLYLLLASVIGRIIFHPQGISITRRFLFICGCIYFFRSITLIVTSLPEPRSSCQSYEASWGSLDSLALVCGDLMFSGHSAVMTLVALCWMEYTRNVFAWMGIWIVAIVGMIGLIFQRAQYTIDIVISIFVCVMVWRYYHTILELPLSSRSKLVAWLEALDEELDEEVQTPVNPEDNHEVVVNPNDKSYHELSHMNIGF